MSAAAEVDILLATYDGAPFLEQQIDSLLAQSFTGGRLTIRDDGSTDATPAILARYAADHPDRIRILQDDRGNLGPTANFSALLEASTADYVMFCDQDDVWLPDKVALSHAGMRALEARHGREMPLLIHCDLRVVDRELREIHPSLRRYFRNDPRHSGRLNRALLQCIAPGCAAMINGRLRDLARPIPAAARMHDWWVALIAAALGRVGHIDAALILYRQHGGNESGAKQWSLPALARNLASSGLGFGREKRAILRHTQRQAAAFLDRFDEAMAAEDRRMVARYASIAERNALARRLDLIRYGLRFDDNLKNAGLFVLI